MAAAPDSERRRLFLCRNKRSFHTGFERKSPTRVTEFEDPASIRARQIVMARSEILRNNPAGSFSYASASGGLTTTGSERMPKMWTSRTAHTCEACSCSLERGR